LNATYLMLRVDENVPTQTQLGRFECRDADWGENAKTKMSLHSSYDLALSRATGIHVSNSKNNEGPFSLDEKSGRLFVSKKLDRETQDSFEYVLVCHDINLNASLNVHIRVNDVNDNCPRGLNKTEMKLYKSVYVNKDEGEFDIRESLFTEFYLDDDLGNNGKLNFAIETHPDIFEVKKREKTYFIN
jgi:hypothetical protein